MSDPLYRDPVAVDPRRMDPDIPRAPYEYSERGDAASWILGAFVAILVVGGLVYLSAGDAPRVANAPADPATVSRTIPPADTNTGAMPSRPRAVEPALPAPTQRP